MSDIIISRAELQEKVDSINSQIERHENIVSELRKELEHLAYLQNNFGADAVSKPRTKNHKSTKAVIVDILKNSMQEMTWKEIFDEFVKIRPDIKVETMRVSLSGVCTDARFHVQVVKDGNNFRYKYSGQ